jgi:TRAP-type C4-dicarboxylate transport system permease large subunit
VRWTVWRHPQAGAAGQRFPWPAKLAALRQVSGFDLPFVASLGGVHSGVCSATEAAGAGGAMLIAPFLGELTIRPLAEASTETVKTAAMLFAVLIGVQIFQRFIVRRRAGRLACLRHRHLSDFAGLYPSWLRL